MIDGHKAHKYRAIGIGNGACHVGYASVTTCIQEDEARANARLIASAPEMFEALKNLMEVVDWLSSSGNLKSPIEPHPFGLGVIQAKQDARTALRKATGG